MERGGYCSRGSTRGRGGYGGRGGGGGGRGGGYADVVYGPGGRGVTVEPVTVAMEVTTINRRNRISSGFAAAGLPIISRGGRRLILLTRIHELFNRMAIFGVFDGHGGAKAAEFATENLGKNIVDEVVRKDDDKEIEESIKHGYMNTDSEFLKGEFKGGSCYVTALIRNGALAVSNAGDCRAVLSRGGAPEALTTDHRPSREDERTRIENLGGYVERCHGTWRIQGSLAVSRGIGDRHLKQFVTAEPETQVLKLTPEHEFVILASDGLWDKVSNQEAVDIVRPSCLGIDLHA